MKKMTASFISMLVGFVIAFCGFAVGWLMADSKYESEKIKLQAAIDNEKHESLLLEKQVADLTEEKTELHGEISRLTDEIETLNDVIVRMRTAPEAAKLLKERIPYGMTNTLRFMDYRKITDKNSIQYRLQEDCETNYDTGIRAYYVHETKTDYYCAALGSAYGRDIGDTWHVTLACGTEFDIILAEYKDDGTTDYFGHPDENYDDIDCTNVIEFVVDEEYMNPVVKEKGSFTASDYYGGLYGYGGNIKKMTYTGRVWEP